MKKFYFILSLCLFALSFSSFSQLKLRSDNWVQMGSQSYGAFAIGIGTSSPNNGAWAIDHYNGGLNFWKPFPTSNYGNYFLFIKDDNGFVGIGRIPSYKLDVEGDIATYGTLRISSDQKLKKNVQDIDGSLDKLGKLRGVSFSKIIPAKKVETFSNNNDETKKKTQVENKEIEENGIGFIAQEVKQVFPELVKEDKDGYLSVDYISLIPVLVEAIKTQQTQIEELNTQIANCCQNNLKSASITSETKESKARLDQNIPNPFSKETRVGCFIPDDATNSTLYIYNLNGIQLQQYNVLGKGEQSVTIIGNSFQPGMYLYTLVIDNKEINTKRMILTK